ncbi:hypothetical protein HPP92_026186 [Vanilla planifolia]|uniref:Ureidoglycolate hydrolase n=1 Tax=Vanilla planifolia TaxID=51239 RepID=A0A835RGY3_VANPL|nr:hypothetical protein HPP92_026186 [Vanilla planifolia]KAG0488774.1 hypothetical protein HPP92_007585 [Vanilla planifolia]
MTRTIKLRPIDATPESFADFGQVISASGERQQYGPNDAQLELHRGTPRFYIMHLEDRKLEFSRITHHASVTQCLGSASGEVWYLGVAKSSILEGSNLNEGSGQMSIQSRCGHSYIPPCLDDVCIFRVTGSKFLKLHRGAWHAGPLFKTKAMDFYNLELSDTNIVDHTTHDFLKEDGAIFVAMED